MSSRKPKAPGVVTFAAVLFTIAGFFHGIEGLGAIFKKEYFNEASLLYSNLQVWAWASLILGVLQISAAYMIIGRATAGRTLGIVVASISAIATFFSIEAPSAGRGTADRRRCPDRLRVDRARGRVRPRRDRGGPDGAPARAVGATVRLIGFGPAAPLGTAGWPTEVAPYWGLRPSDGQVHSAPWTSELRARPMDGGATRARAAVSFPGPQRTRERLRRPGVRVLGFPIRARSSAGERSPHTREVAGSIPAAPTTKAAGQRLGSSTTTCSPGRARRTRAARASARTSSRRSASATSSDGNRWP